MADIAGRKKFKADEGSIFDKFWEYPYAVQRLQKTLELLKSSEFSFCLLKIINCNAATCRPFSRAFCDTKNNSENGMSISAFTFWSVFKPGCAMLLDYCSDEKKVPVGRHEKLALERLLRVLMDIKGRSIISRRYNYSHYS